MTPANSVTVTLIHRPKPRFLSSKRHQPWRWVARARNGRVLATSGEAYFNKADCVSSIWTLFGPGSLVALQTEDGEFLLRSYEAEWQ